MSVYDDEDGATTLFRRVPATGSQLKRSMAAPPIPPPPIAPPVQAAQQQPWSGSGARVDSPVDHEICEGCRMAFPGAGSDASGMCPECATTLWHRDTPPGGLAVSRSSHEPEPEPEPEFQRFARPWPYVLGFSAAAVAGAMLLLVAERVLPAEAWTRAYTAAKLRWSPADHPSDRQPGPFAPSEGRACGVRRK